MVAVILLDSLRSQKKVYQVRFELDFLSFFDLNFHLFLTLTSFLGSCSFFYYIIVLILPSFPLACPPLASLGGFRHGLRITCPVC